MHARKKEEKGTGNILPHGRRKKRGGNRIGSSSAFPIVLGCGSGKKAMKIKKKSFSRGEGKVFWCFLSSERENTHSGTADIGGGKRIGMEALEENEKKRRDWLWAKRNGGSGKREAKNNPVWIGVNGR